MEEPKPFVFRELNFIYNESRADSSSSIVKGSPPAFDKYVKLAHAFELARVECTGCGSSRAAEQSVDGAPAPLSPRSQKVALSESLYPWVDV